MTCLILILKPEIDTKQRGYYSLAYLMNTDAKIFNKILANLIQQYIKKDHTARLHGIYLYNARLVEYLHIN